MGMEFNRTQVQWFTMNGGVANNYDYKQWPPPTDSYGEEGGGGITTLAWGREAVGTVGQFMVGLSLRRSLSSAKNRGVAFSNRFEPNGANFAGGPDDFPDGQSTCYDVGRGVSNQFVAGAKHYIFFGGKWEAGYSGGQFFPSLCAQGWSSTANGFISGSSCSNTQFCRGLNASTGSIMVGAQGLTATDPWNGSLEECRAYTRPLRQKEFRTIQACKGHDGIHWKLALRLRMNELPAGTVMSLSSVKDVSEQRLQVLSTSVSAPQYTGGMLSFRRRMRST